MKNAMRITAMVAILVFASSSVINAQNFRRANNSMGYQGQCMNIPELSEKQKTKITELNTAHRELVDQMREELFASEDRIKANEIRAKMALEQNTHLEKISAELTAEQKTWFNENVLAKPSTGQGREFARGPRGGRASHFNGPARGRGNFRADRPQRGRGPGSCWMD